jgi:peptide deformylase
MDSAPLKPTDERLRLVCDVVQPHELRAKAFQTQIDRLIAYVYGNNPKGTEGKPSRPITVGLSANQVGIMKRICVVDMAIGQKGFHDLHVWVNPRITKRSKAMQTQSEGCVNLPQIWGPVTRHKTVTVQTLDRSGNKLTLELKGWAAILAQHEIDHLDGKLFIDHLADPTQAHLVADSEIRTYNKKQSANWAKTIDVSHLIS